MHVANVAVAMPTIATLMGILPTVLGLIATLLAIVVYGLQVIDWIEKRRAKRVISGAKADKIAAKVVAAADALKDSSEKLVQKLDEHAAAPPKE